jgi:hypothetical protein
MTPIDAPPGTIVMVSPGGQLSGGVPLFYGEVVWSRGSVAVASPGIVTVRRFARASDAKKPLRTELAPLIVSGPTPLELAIDACIERLRACYATGDWECAVAENARLVALYERLAAGETDVRGGGE